MSGPEGARFGEMTPRVAVEPPGPRSRALAEELARLESRNVTYLGRDFPVFWAEARGSNVRDVDGNVYVDLTAAFAVAGTGHGHPAVVRAIREQAGRLVHGMGDVHPPEIKVELLRRLAEVTPGGLDRAILANSGAEAIEAALKTVMLRTGKPKVLSFSGGYHGLTYGALALNGRDDFRDPFRAQLADLRVIAPFPYPYRSPYGDDADAGEALASVERLLDLHSDTVGAILVEPVQGRGGDVVPPDPWLRGLRALCDARGVLLVLDEIYTGFGRTGRWFACEHWGVVPDLLVVGKALTSGLPFAACIGSAEVMDAWPPSPGEALHTSTFLGHPLGCAAAIASIEVLRKERLVERSARVGAATLERLRGRFANSDRVGEVRGLGMMIGVELVRDRESREPAPELVGRVVVGALKRGVLVLGGGVHGNVLSLSPPFTIPEPLLGKALDVIEELVSAL